MISKFEEINLNPKHRQTSDCVIRAIAYATNQRWDDVYRDLCDIGLMMKLMPNDKKVYEKYLDSLGWHKHRQPRKYDNTKYRVDEFNEIALYDVYILNTTHHLTVIDNGIIKDTWNPGFKTVGNYWCKEYRYIGEK